MIELPALEELSRLAREGRLVRLELPDAEEVEVYLVRLEDGRLVARTREELESESGPVLPAGEG